jgi:hypothetical protein
VETRCKEEKEEGFGYFLIYLDAIFRMCDEH